VVILHITNMEVQLSSARTCEVFMTWLAIWDRNLIVQLGMVIMNTLVERS